MDPVNIAHLNDIYWELPDGKVIWHFSNSYSPLFRTYKCIKNRHTVMIIVPIKQRNIQLIEYDIKHFNSWHISTSYLTKEDFYFAAEVFTKLCEFHHVSSDKCAELLNVISSFQIKQDLVIAKKRALLITIDKFRIFRPELLPTINDYCYRLAPHGPNIQREKVYLYRFDPRFGHVRNHSITLHNSISLINEYRTNTIIDAFILYYLFKKPTDTIENSFIRVRKICYDFCKDTRKEIKDQLVIKYM